ncbi:MAG TPA: response regulator [Gemmatimonadales bacterium]|jgi:two-component system cell cycle sensor histidine kinase/response regulator CckA|nr:response regulator [Gemmatimonadales bacterium]
MTEDQFPYIQRVSPQSILVVDDTSVVRRAAFRLLSEAGYRVFESESAEEALEVLRTARPPVDLALIDVVMPTVSGVDLGRMIQAQWPGIMIVYMSAYQAEVMVREGLEEPRVLFLAKPFTREELLSKITDALIAKRKHNGQQSRSDLSS